jgi:RNA polymerase sigma-70 factor (ECF subfamily)
MQNRGNFSPCTGVSLTMGMQEKNTSDDAVLLEASRKGDLAAFECLVQRHQHMLFNIAYRMTGVYEDACDIVQDTFIAAWLKMSDFRGEAKLATWLTAIVINQSRNRRQQIRQRERREAYSLDAPLSGNDRESLPELPSRTSSALEQMEDAELRSFLMRCIDSLPPEFREVLVLRDMQELSYDEVAVALELREGTVKSRLFRARDSVKECLKKAVGKT